jgi:predicted unusual protein kinase regulating ubiquinone biosynthesis (AarF/ABC1/UbiB family)
VSERRRAERRVGLARLWARAKQIVTTDPGASGDDDHLVDEEAARVLAANAGRLKGGLAKVAQLAAYDPGATLGGRSGATAAARAVLAGLWDHAPAVSAGAIARVIEDDLGRAPEALFARWDAAPLAAASLGQVHAAALGDGTEVVVKVQYPGVAEALRADLDDAAFVRKLAGAELGGTLGGDALAALAAAVRGELDYRAEAAAQARFAAAWAGHRVLRVPRVVAELSSARVLTMTRARGKTVVEVAASGSPEVRRQAALAIYQFAWGSPLVHRLLNADPNPGNFLIDAEPVRRASEARTGEAEIEQADGAVHVWCLDFGCAGELEERVRDADRELWWALVDDDGASAAERFRVGLARSGLLQRPDSMATHAHRDWERSLAQPLATHGDFPWSAAYARELAENTGRVLAAGGVRLPASVLLLWRQRLGAAAVLGMLDARAPFRRALVELIGSGRRALR